MIKLPSVTIVIPYKDNLKYLFPALKSILRQEFKNFKILIIYDDEDRSDLLKIEKFIKSIKARKRISIKIIINKISLGAGYARNIGIKKCKTKYIAFLDSDDLWTKNKLKTQIDFMEKNKLLFSHSSYFVIDSNNKILSTRKAKPLITYDQLIKSCDIGLSTVVLNLNFIKKNNFYFPNIQTKEDYVLWLKILKKIKSVRGIEKKLSYYRKTNNSLSSNKFRSLINGYKVYKNYMHFSLIKSLYYLFVLSVNSLKKNIKLKL